jgi:hypothetical protein
MSKLSIVIDNDTTKLVLGGFAAWANENDEVQFGKVLGLYKEHGEMFDIVNKDIVIIEQTKLNPAKLMIEGIDVAKESYRVFVTNLDNDFEYIVKSYFRKPLPKEEVDIIDIKLLNSPIFNKLSDKSVVVQNYDSAHHNYSCITKGGIEIYLRRNQFILQKDNKVNIAFLDNINKD